MPAASDGGDATADNVSKEADQIKTSAVRANSEAAELRKVFNAVKPTSPDNYKPSFGMPGGGDIHLQPGLYTGHLIRPGVWPTESETELAQSAARLKKLSEHHQDAAAAAERSKDEVFAPGGHWPHGDGADAAFEHYEAEEKAHKALVGVLDRVAATLNRLSDLIRLGKRNIRDAHDAAHRERSRTTSTRRAAFQPPVSASSQ